MKKQILVALVAGSALLTLAACGSSNGSSSTSTSSSDKALSGKIIAGGSTALQPLAQQASTEFMAKNPNVQVTVQGGGSGVGLTQVAAGSFQIGNSDIFAEEKSGIDASAITDHKVAVVGFAPIVNAKIDVKNLTSQQLQDVFTGKVTNWKQVGGPDQKITVIGRTEGSGTRVNFDKFALGGATEVNGPTQDASGSVVTMVGQTPGAVSYVALSYVDTSKDIKAVSIDGVEPTEENVATNDYKVWSYEHMYTNAKKESAADKAFIKYIANDTTDIKKLGYIPVSDMKVSRDADGNVTNK
ncbi:MULTISPECIES: phosphate ABC transporter substrate-binding protein [Lactococcus]|uniref:Phosphate-binding protein n=2 Tax=Lactococcus TaxID=1357 RepID=A0A387BIN0_9LACT|nr:MULTISPECIES: phosphate ABC transporter substrate-binding protein [Lactococcus]AYG00750.1 phosphate ABC transporter substrate-binding protein [Lactococcus allomyrinae]MCL2112920.1 phosphate ABC transporter substrate-binding protein [Streptococcaceae bacterium]QDK71683.1 phosphate ABC transporter substrate-binding protein [Lactococcus protaetiae]